MDKQTIEVREPASAPKSSQITCLFLGIFFFCYASLFYFDFIMFIVGDTFAVFVNRAGIVLQLIGVFSAIPDFIDKEKFIDAEKYFSNIGDQLKAELFSITKLEKGLDVKVLFQNGIVRSVNFISKILVYLLLLRMGVLTYINPNNQSPEMWYFIILYGGILFATIWLAFVAITLVLGVKKKPLPNVFKFLFAILDSVMTILGWPVTFVLVLILKPILGYFQKVSKLPLRKVLIRITFPMVVIGTLLTLFATYLWF